MKDTLIELMEKQHQLQVRMGVDPFAMTREERLQYIDKMYIALGKELGEFMDEIPWKPWASNKTLNPEAAFKELIDAQHFLNNLFLAIAAELRLCGPATTAVTIHKHYLGKNRVNHDRQTRGYDGKSEKCICGRAIDDGYRDPLNDREREEGSLDKAGTTVTKLEAYQCVCGQLNHLEAV